MKFIGFILSRLGHGLLIMLGVLVAVFFLFNVLPGDPVYAVERLVLQVARRRR